MRDVGERLHYYQYNTYILAYSTSKDGTSFLCPTCFVYDGSFNEVLAVCRNLLYDPKVERAETHNMPTIRIFRRVDAPSATRMPATSRAETAQTPTSIKVFLIRVRGGDVLPYWVGCDEIRTSPLAFLSFWKGGNNVVG